MSQSLLQTLALSAAQRKELEDATADYAERLTPEAEDYLASRGLLEAARTARVGVVGDPHPGHEIARGRLVIPYLTPNGVVALRFRDLTDKANAKYLSLFGAQPRLYNVSVLHTRSRHIAIVEGELDALASTHLLGLPAVGIPGTQTWFSHHPRVFADYEQVFVICDNDVKYDKDNNLERNGGQVLAKRIAEEIPQATVITPPENVDLNEWILRDGAQKVSEAIGISLLQSPEMDVNITLEGEGHGSTEPLPPY